MGQRASAADAHRVRAPGPAARCAPLAPSDTHPEVDASSGERGSRVLRRERGSARSASAFRGRRGLRPASAGAASSGRRSSRPRGAALAALSGVQVHAFEENDARFEGRGYGRSAIWRVGVLEGDEAAPRAIDVGFQSGGRRRWCARWRRAPSCAARTIAARLLLVVRAVTRRALARLVRHRLAVRPQLEAQLPDQRA